MHDLHRDVAPVLHVVREIDRRRPAPSQLSRQTIAVDEHVVDVHHAFRLIAGLQLLLIECDAPTLDAGPIVAQVVVPQLERMATSPAGQSSTKLAAPLPAPVAYSPETGRTYRLDRLIGKGGFGEVYLATPTPADGFPPKVCVKITERLSAWLREAYFAELLERQPRALRVFDRFAIVDGSRMRYCLAMEYAEHGDLGAWLGKKGAQPERFVRREIAAVLEALDALHRGQALHRDLTPFNVFVCEDEQLKLGDFGIATHQLSRRGVTADAFNVFNAPDEIAWGRVRRWQQRDDIYQVAQIATMLLRGDT